MEDQTINLDTFPTELQNKKILLDSIIKYLSILIAVACLKKRKKERSRQDSNLRGNIPSDFESDALTTRPRLLLLMQRAQLLVLLKRKQMPNFEVQNFKVQNVDNNVLFISCARICTPMNKNISKLYLQY